MKAQASAGSVFVAWDHGLGVDANHAAAAQALAEKMGWGGKWFAGGLPNERGNVYVCVTSMSEGVGYPESLAFTSLERR